MFKHHIARFNQRSNQAKEHFPSQASMRTAVVEVDGCSPEGIRSTPTGKKRPMGNRLMSYSMIGPPGISRREAMTYG
jgi:hypothetical protein